VTTLVLNGVGKRFGGVEAVVGVDLDVRPGTITGLIGPNGAGKSTLVNLITGFLKLTAGSIRLDGVDLTEASAEAVARAGVARTFQNIRLLAEASVLDNVAIGFHRHEHASLLSALFYLPRSTRESRDYRTRARDLLTRFGMGRYAEHPAGDLAYGHQRRVEIMRAVASAPRTLLLDEPVAGMNDVEAADLGRIFTELAASGIGVLLIEHNIRFVNKLCSTVNVLSGGRMIARGSPSEIMRDDNVVSAYLGA
jgi:branched-chain amino acid transport system ATP-binding protein